MNLFENILKKAKTGVNYLATGKAGSDLYDWANPEQQDPIQRFFDDPAQDMSKKQALMDNLKSGVPVDVMKSYVTEKYYKPVELKQTVPTVNPTFQYTGQESPAMGALKTIGNIPSNIYNIGATTANLASTAYQEGIPETAGMIARGVVKQAGQGAQNVATSYQNQGLIGATNTVLEGANKFLMENPIDVVGTPAVGSLATKGVKTGAKALVKGAEVVAPKVAQGVKTGVQATGEGVGKLSKSIVSQQSGLGTQAIESILKKPELQGKIRSGELSAARTLEEARTSIDALREGFRETGKMYENIRKSDVKVPTNEAKQVLLSQLESDGLASGGKLNLVDLPVKDRGAITQALKYIDEYKGDMNPQNALSIRQKLDDLINYKSDVGSNGQRIVQGLRAKYDEYLGQKLPGLKDIDTKYAPERQFWESIRKDIYKADGTLKDNALSVVSNITNKGNEARLARMEKILPGIGEKVKALKAFEDVQNASGIKVGTYTRAATTGGLAIVNPAIAIATWAATHPAVVARVLESIGLASQKIKSILAKGKNISKEEATIIEKAVKQTPKSKVEGIINNLSYDPKTSKLTSKTLIKNGNNSVRTVAIGNKGNIGKMEQKTPIIKPKNESKVIKPTSSTNTANDIPEGYTKNVFGEVIKKPGYKKGGFVKVPGTSPDIKPIKKLNTGEEITLVRGTGGKGSGAGEAIRGKGLYLTDNVDVAKHYGPELKTVTLKNSDILDGGETLKNSRQIIKSLPKEMKAYLDDTFDYSYNSLIKTIEGNTGIEAEAIAEAINSAIKGKYKGVKFEIGLVNDELMDRGLGNKNAFVIF